MSTVVATARSNLYSLLEDHTWSVNHAGEKPQITPAFPLYQEQEVVGLAGVEEVTHGEPSLGGNRQEEEFTLVVGVKVYDPALDPLDVDARGWELADEARTLVHTTDATDRNLRGAVRQVRSIGFRSAGVEPARSEDGPLPGWVIFIDVLFRCAQRITAT